MAFLFSLFSSQPAGNLPDTQSSLPSWQEDIVDSGAVKPTDTQSSLPSEQEDIVDSGAVKPADTELRIMGAGPCNFPVAVGKLTFPCPCQQGVFKFPPNTLIRDDEECDSCSHPLSMHEEFSRASGQNSLPC